MNRFVELKRCLPVNFTRELRGYLQGIYKNVSENEFDAELGELDKLRQECAMATISQASINNILLRYYLQLLDMENRINLDMADIKVPFAWYNCSAGDDKKIIVSASNIRFEEACVLFNVAACYIQLAALESTSTSEGLKRACNYYMMAAGVFQYISESLTCNFDVPTAADVSPVTLNFLMKWSLAAAQECFVLKGIAEKTIKDGMLAKLALATGQMYETARELGEELGIGSIYGKYLMAFLIGRATYYKSLAQVKKAAESLVAGRYGEEISRLNEATHLLNRCKEHKKLMDPETLNYLDTLTGHVVRNLERAIKDNSIIYHENVPAATGLPDIGQAIVARATIMPDWSKEGNIPSRPILARLVPETIRLRSVEYYTKRNERVEAVYARLRGLKTLEQEIMRECNLPSLLEVSRTTMGLPTSILEKSEQIRSSGGISSLYSTMSTVEALKTDAKQLLKQIEELLSEERKADNQARIEFGSKWTRPESEGLSSNLLGALESYRKSLLAAGQSDVKLQKDFDESVVGITALDSSQAELEESIPASTASNAQRGDSMLAKKLRARLDQVGEFEQQRNQLISMFQDYCGNDQVEEAFTALGEEVLKSDEAAESCISTRLQSDLMRQLESEFESIETNQEVQLKELKHLADSFAASLTLSSALEERQNALQTLEQAALSYTNLNIHLQEALNFYSGLLELLQKLRENARDFTVSRGIELDEIRATLRRSMNAHTSNFNASFNNDDHVSNANSYNTNAYSNAPGRSSSFANDFYNNTGPMAPIQTAAAAGSYSQVPSFPQHPQQGPVYPGQSFMMPPPIRNNAEHGYQSQQQFMPTMSNSASSSQVAPGQWQPGMPVVYNDQVPHITTNPQNPLPPQYQSQQNLQNQHQQNFFNNPYS